MKRADVAGKLIGRLGHYELSSLLANRWIAGTVHDGPVRTVEWDARADQYTVRDADGQTLAITQHGPKRTMHVQLSDGRELPDFSIQKGWLRRYKAIYLADQQFRPVFMLEGRIRVFGNNTLRIEHRDFKSEVTYICDPAMEMVALIVAFLLFNTPNCRAS